MFEFCYVWNTARSQTLKLSIYLSDFQFIVDFAAVLAIVVVVNYWLLAPTVVISIVFYLMRTVYVNAGRSIKRMEAICKFWKILYLSDSEKSFQYIFLQRGVLFFHIRTRRSKESLRFDHSVLNLCWKRNFTTSKIVTLRLTTYF